MADGYRAEADEAEAEAVEAENDERDEKKKEAHGQDSGSDGERMIGAPSVAVEVVARRALAVAVRGAAAVLAPRALTRGPRRRGRGVGGGHLGACRSGDGEGEAGGLHPPDHGALALHVAAAAQRSPWQIHLPLHHCDQGQSSDDSTVFLWPPKAFAAREEGRQPALPKAPREPVDRPRHSCKVHSVNTGSSS